MVLVTSNKSQRLLSFIYAGRVGPEELQAVWEETKALVAELPPGVRVLADLSHLDFMDPQCMAEIGRTMDLLHKHGVSLIVRAIPDESKDIGLNILTIFHYPNHPRIITCDSLPKALRQLALWH